ncbi:hypothetical protein BDR04DRAFT_1131191 [Suillus decipiens]|nr:hypothetical protein BDR04DRAFT_1131191 [Suillus decipiens]
MLEDVPGFNCARESKLMDAYLQDRTNPLREEFGWRQSTVKIHLPKERQTWPSEKHAPELEVPGVYHRSLTSIIRSTFEDDISKTFHMTPYSEYWKISDTKTVQVFSEAYSSPTMLDAYAEINALPHEPEDDLERVLAPLMMWSDATHLANFGDASLWPFYLYFGNQSKYTRGKPMSSACHHVAYIPLLPDNLQDIYVDIFGEGTTDQVHTFLKRELVQVIWQLLLDGDFMHAYEHGIVIDCSDGITQHVFPRFFSYSADYPEKVLLATIKFLGDCLCPRCLIKKADVPDMGTKLDMKRRETRQMVDNEWRRRRVEDARKLIFRTGASVDGARVKALLNAESYVPVRNAFSVQLAPFDFNVFMMFVIDLLHEFELGVWKAIFIHLLCILHAQGGTVIQDLNER